MFSSLKTWLIIIGLLFLIGLGAGAYFYVSGQQETIAFQAGEIAKKDIVIGEQRRTVEKQQENIRELTNLHAEAQGQLSVSNARIETLESKFERHDTELLAKRKPGLYERAINKGTRESARCWEITTGDRLTPEEVSAVKPSEINSQCWNIANPNFVWEDQSDAWKEKNPRK